LLPRVLAPNAQQSPHRLGAIRYHPERLHFSATLSNRDRDRFCMHVQPNESPWGDAMFNQAQADDLEEDIADVKRGNPDPNVLDILIRLELLVARLSEETHAYLWFIGD
jgi:hypothetical protein